MLYKKENLRHWHLKNGLKSVASGIVPMWRFMLDFMSLLNVEAPVLKVEILNLEAEETGS